MIKLSSLGSSEKMLIGLGFIVIPLIAYVVYKKVAPKEDPVELAINTNGDSIVLPTVDVEGETTDLDKSDLYESKFKREESDKIKRANEKDPFKTLKDDNFYGADGSTDKKSQFEDSYNKKSEPVVVEEVLDKPKPKYKPKQEVTTKVEEAPKRSFDFYSNGSTASNTIDAGSTNKSGKAIPSNELTQAVVHNEQTVTNGSTLRVRLLSDVIVNGVTIPANTVLWGNVSFKQDRVTISFSNVTLASRLISLDKKAYGKDGLEGIPTADIPGADQLIRETQNNTANNIGRTNPLLGAVANGVQTLNQRDIKITFRDEFPFYIK